MTCDDKVNRKIVHNTAAGNQLAMDANRFKAQYFHKNVLIISKPSAK